jgi:hypothetical protein
MREQEATGELARFATDLEIEGLDVHRVSVALDDRRDGEPVTRITLLVDDPRAGEGTWRLDAVVEPKRQLSRKAVELGLPAASVTLVPESEAALVASFSR